jgi:hypothetical protein
MGLKWSRVLVVVVVDFHAHSLVLSRKAQHKTNLHSLHVNDDDDYEKLHKAVRHSQQFRHQLHSQDSIKGSIHPLQPSSLLHIKPQPQHFFFFFFFNQYPFRQHPKHSKHSKHTSIIVYQSISQHKKFKLSRQLIRRLSV